MILRVIGAPGEFPRLKWGKAGTERESRWEGVGLHVELLQISVEVGGFIWDVLG